MTQCFDGALSLARTLVDSQELVLWRRSPLVAKFGMQPVQKIRIRNSDVDFLHLTGVALKAAGETYGLDFASYQCTGGAEFQGKGEIPEFELNSLVKPYAFHTLHTLEDNWFEVEFSVPIEIDEIEVYPRGGGFEIRSVSLVIEISSGDSPWDLVYSNPLTIREELSGHTSQISEDCSWTPAKFNWVLYFFVRLLSGSNLCIPKALDEWSLFGGDSGNLLRFINREILAEQGIEFVQGAGMRRIVLES